MQTLEEGSLSVKPSQSPCGKNRSYAYEPPILNMAEMAVFLDLLVRTFRNDGSESTMIARSNTRLMIKTLICAAARLAQEPCLTLSQ